MADEEVVRKACLRWQKDGVCNVGVKQSWTRKQRHGCSSRSSSRKCPHCAGSYKKALAMKMIKGDS
jgi:hypothetical protein